MGIPAIPECLRKQQDNLLFLRESNVDLEKGHWQIYKAK